MSIIPILRAREIISLLLKLGFSIVRQRGSHVRLRHLFDPTKNVSVPMHNKDVPPRILLSILKQAQITLSDFLKIVRK